MHSWRNNKRPNVHNLLLSEIPKHNLKIEINIMYGKWTPIFYQIYFLYSGYDFNDINQ